MRGKNVVLRSIGFGEKWKDRALVDMNRGVTIEGGSCGRKKEPTKRKGIDYGAYSGCSKQISTLRVWNFQGSKT